MLKPDCIIFLAILLKHVESFTYISFVFLLSILFKIKSKIAFKKFYSLLNSVLI